MENNHNIWALAQILAYDQIRSHEEYEMKKAELEIVAGSKIK